MSVLDHRKLRTSGFGRKGVILKKKCIPLPILLGRCNETERPTQKIVRVGQQVSETGRPTDAQSLEPAVRRTLALIPAVRRTLTSDIRCPIRTK